MKFDLRLCFLKAGMLAFVFMFSNNSLLFSQTRLKGKVVNIKDGKPVAFATISINKKKANVLSDSYGNFVLSLRDPRNNDSLFITSVGYKSLKLPLYDAVVKNEFALSEQAEDLQNVIIKSYTNEDAVGSRSEITGYFRYWNPERTGGEIGRIFYIDHEDYKLERVRFKVNNQCDTCRIRLHIRELVNDQPGDELLNDSIATEVHRLSFDDKFSEFDLRPYELILKNKALFVSLEVLNCSKRDGQPCSICYIGTEHGNYIYKTRKDSGWEEFSDYSIYLKLFYKY